MRWLLLLLLCACDVPAQGELATEPSGQLADFRTYVQPVLAASCGTLDCHGQAGRPLRLHAKFGLRLDLGLRVPKELDESDDELLANMRAIAAMAPASGQVEDDLLLLKPLAVSAGGMHHVGGDLFPDQRDLAYRCLHAWLRAGVSDDAGRAVCTEAAP